MVPPPELRNFALKALVTCTMILDKYKSERRVVPLVESFMSD